jgi:predicted ATPase
MEAERTRLRDLVLSPASRIVTLLGPGGAGKTHLARVVLHELATAFEHGMAMVRLDDLAPCRAGRGSAALLSRLAAAVGTDLVPGRELDSLAEGLRGRQQIVLVDNFETVADAWPTLGALSERLPGVTFVVTSRHQLGLPTEWVVRLHGLDWPRTARWQPAHGAVPAPALFLGAAERLGLPVDTARDGDAVIRICAAVEGWPLGLILSASWLQVYGCAAVAARLEGSAALLANPAPARIEPRHRSATAVLDQSWALLDGEERAGFAALCVFAGRFDAAAAEAVAGVTAATLAALVGKSLVRREAGDALSVHPLLRDYGHRQLDAMPALRDRVHAAHAARSAAMLAAARDAFGACGDPAAFDAAAERVGDHLAAFRRLAVAPDRPGLDGFLGDLWLLHRSRGWIEDGAALLEEALALPGLDAGRVAQWRLWHSDALFQLGRVDASGEAARAALAALGERPAVGAGGAAVAAGLARVLLGQPRRAPGGHGATVAARAWNRIAQARFFEGDRDGFVAATLRSVTYRGAGSLPANLASTALVLGYTPFRASAARAALRAERTLHAADPFDRAWAHEQLALHGLGLGELDAARHHALEGAAIFRRLGQRRNWGECQTLATYGHFFAGRIAAARDEMAAVRDEARRLHEPAAELWGALGVLACDLMTGGAAEAFDDRRARSLAAAVPDPNTRLLLHGILAWRAACEGRPDEAREERQRFDMAFRSADMLSVYALNGFVADFRALLVLCEATPGDLHHAARRPISRLRRFARTFPAARPRLAEAVRLVRDARLPGGRGRDA